MKNSSENPSSSRQFTDPSRNTSWDSITLAANALSAAQQNGIVVYKTQADMRADRHQQAGKVAWVLIDPSPRANASYIWDGSQWQPTFDRLNFALGSGSGFQQEGGRLRSFSEKERDFVSVLDYATASGGVPGQGGDDTTAFMAAANASPNVYVPPGTYQVNAARIPRGTHIFGDSPVYYLSSHVNSRAATIRPHGTATSLFKIEGNVTLTGIVAIGNRSGTVFSPAGPTRANNVKLIQCSIFRFSAGISGSAFPGYLGGFLAENSTFAENDTGITNIVDSCIIGGTINANASDGIHLGPGANDNTILGAKVEWNGANNISLINSKNNVIVGGVIDRAVNSGIYIGAQAQCIVNGVMLRRNGKSGAIKDAHITLEHDAEATISGIKTRSGADDDGTGISSPQTAIALVNGKASLLQISNSDLRGCVGTRPIIDELTPVFYRVSGCPGIPDIKDQQHLPRISPSGGSASSTFYLPALGSFDARVIRLRFTAQSENSLRILFGIIPITLLRRGEAASAVINTPEYLSETDAFGTNATSSLQLSILSVAEDGSIITIGLTNNHNDSNFNVRVEHT